MNYGTVINESIENVYKSGIAAKILQHMDRIRNVSDLGQARRWVMELLQNARDTAFDDQPVRVQIILEKDKIQFRHNGKPFRIKDILSIINQVSSKVPDEKTVGQFGTGFMTTYQLSEIVEIQSILKNEGMPYKPFSVRLDRRGKDKEEILSSISHSMEELKKADDEYEIRDFDKHEFNTSFIYHLGEEYNYRIAKTGMDDLKETILYVLLFSKQIGGVELEYRVDEAADKICFERGNDESLDDGVRRLEIRETVGSGNDAHSISHFVVYREDDGLFLAACTDADYNFLEIPKLVPRIFVDFPLIGAEEFPFPVILNSRKFKPNEPRSGVTLVDNENSRDAAHNKELMQRAVSLYRQFLHTLIRLGYKGLENVISIPAFREDKEISEKWVRGNVYDTLYEIVSNEPMIETVSGFAHLAADDVYLVAGDTAEERDGVKRLLGALKNHRTPVGKDGWLQAFSGYEQHKSKIWQIKDLFERAQKMLVDFLDEEKMGAIEWCRELYTLGMQNQTMATRISAGEAAIFPNQDKQDWEKRKLFKRNELYKASDIPEILKDVSEALDKIGIYWVLDIRKKLLHTEFMDMEIPQMQEYPVIELYNDIAKRSNGDNMNMAYYGEPLRFAWSRLVSCCPDKELYELAKNSWDIEMPDYEPIGQNIGSFLWKHAYSGILQEITKKIEGLGMLQNVRNAFTKIDGDAFYECFNAFIKKAAEYIYRFDGIVFPDQRGELHWLGFLKKDETEYEELKEIAQVFVSLDGECAFYEKLLDRNIKEGNLSWLSVCSDKDIAMKIGAVITELLSQKSLSEADLAYQEGCTMLLAWIQEHSDEAQRLFPAFWKEEDQMKLLTPKAATVLRKKASMCEKMLKELGAENMEEALEKLSNMRREADSYSGSEGKHYFDPEMDVFYGSDFLGYYADDDIEERLREIGKGGERYAYQRVKEFIMDKGWQMLEESATQARFENPENMGSITVSYPDAQAADGRRGQAGYDICVTVEEAGAKESYYIEVKTHTGTSKVRDILYVSNEQMKLAAKESEKYYVLNVIFDHRIMQGTHVEYFKDPVARIADGTLRNENNKYVLRIARVWL